MKLQHVNVAVPPGSTAEAVVFYEGVLGLRRVPKSSSQDPGPAAPRPDDDRLRSRSPAGKPGPQAPCGLAGSPPGSRLATGQGPETSSEPDVLAGRGGAWLDVDGYAQVHLSERAGAGHDDAHFALVVDDYDGTLARIAAAGAPWRDQEDVFGGRRGCTRDPFGNRIEILERAGYLSSR